MGSQAEEKPMPQYKPRALNTEESSRLDDALTKVFGACAARRLDEDFRYGFFIGMLLKEEN